MNCEEFIEGMSDYLDTEISEEEKKEWKKHCQGCEACRKFFQSFKSGLELMQHLREENCPPNVRERLEKVLGIKIKEYKPNSDL